MGNVRVERVADIGIQAGWIVPGQKIAIRWSVRSGSYVKIHIVEMDGWYDPTGHDYFQITRYTSNDGYYEWEVLEDIFARLGDPLSFPEFKVRIQHADDDKCNVWSDEFRIAYSHLDWESDGSTTVFEADEVELFGGSASASIELSLGMEGSATAFCYMRTGDLHPIEQALAYADVDLHAPSDMEVRINAALAWASNEAVLPVPGRDRDDWSDNPAIVWGIRLFGEPALVGLRVRAFYQLRISIDAELVIPLEKQMAVTGRTCYKFEPSKGPEQVAGSQYNRAFAISEVEGENKDVGGWSFLVQGEIEAALRPEIAAGIWLSSRGRMAIAYVSLDGVITSGLKFWAVAGSAPLVLPAEFAGNSLFGVPNSNCRPNHSVAL